MTTPVRSSAGQGVKQRRERGDLVGLAIHSDLAEHGAGVVVDHREQVPARPGDAVRCRSRREPRRVLPSTASARAARPRYGGPAHRRWTNALITRRTGRRPRVARRRRIVDSTGSAGRSRVRRRPRRAGQRPTRRSRRTTVPRRRPRTPPAVITTTRPMAHPATLARIDHLRQRGRAGRGASVTGSGRSSPPTWSTTAGIGKDADAGTALFR